MTRPRRGRRSASLVHELQLSFSFLTETPLLQALRPSPPPTEPMPDRPAGLAPPSHAGPMPVPAATRPYHHVRANRFAELAGQQVGYELKRSRRRTIGFLVGPDGLTVAAPRWVSLTDVTQGLREKEGWILRKLQEQRERGERAAAAKVDWRDGASLPFMGRRIEIALDPAQAGALLDATTGQLRVGLPGHASPEQIRDAVQAWLMRQASRVFTERLDHFAPLLGVRWQRLRLSSAATRWGSASADGAIRLNWRLIHYSEALIDYVVAHELSHLRVMDHSPAFWETVASVMPDYSTRREQLKDEQLPVL